MRIPLARASMPAGPAIVPPSRRLGQLTIEIRTEGRLGAADGEAVRALCHARPGLGIFVSPAWLSGYFEEPPAGMRAALAIVREAGELRAIAPIGVSSSMGQFHATLLGGGAASDRVDLLAARGYEARCADALLWWLGQWSGPRGFVLRLRDVPHDSPLWSALGRWQTQRAVVPREVTPAPFLDLQEYRADLLSGVRTVAEHRSSLARHRRWLESRGKLRVELAREPGEALAWFDTLVRFLHERWGEGASALDNAAQQRFHRRVVPRLLAEGLLRMMRISVDLRTVAVFYGFAVADWWGYYLAGYDRAWAGRIHLGRLTLAFAIDLALQSGATEFDFLKGGEPVKYLWPVRERVAVDADVYTGTRGAQLLRASAASRELGAALAGAARPKWSAI